MRKVFWWIMVCAILVASVIGLLYWGLLYSQRDYASEVQDLGPEQIVKYYCDAHSMRSNEKMMAVLSKEMKTRTFGPWSAIDIEVVSVETVAVAELSYLPHTTEGLYELNVYKVETKHSSKGETEEKTSIGYYFIGKETADSPWLIYEMSSIMEK